MLCPPTAIAAGSIWLAFAIRSMIEFSMITWFNRSARRVTSMGKLELRFEPRLRSRVSLRRGIQSR